MSSDLRWPAQRIAVTSDGSKLVVARGTQLQVVEESSGAFLAAAALSPPHSPNSHSPFPRLLSISPDDRYLASTGDDKVLRIWDLVSFEGALEAEGERGSLPRLRLVNEREMPKRASTMCWEKAGLTIIVGDKFGDVRSFPLHCAPTAEPSEPSERPAKKAKLEPGAERGEAAGESDADGDADGDADPEDEAERSGSTLVLGHVSLLTCCLLTPDEKFIVTADRDEHVRVSWYPQGYVIQRFLFGHRKFVSALLTLPRPLSHPSLPSTLLLSAGGDSAIFTWDYMSGRLLHTAQVDDVVRRFGAPINWEKERARSHSWPSVKDKAKEENGSNAPQSSTAQSAPPPASTHDLSRDVGRVGGQTCISHVTLIDLDGQQALLFVNEGCTAIFHLPVTSLLPAPDSSLTETSHSHPSVQAHDLGSPVLDVAVTRSPDGSATRIWATLDVRDEFAKDGSGGGKDVRCLEWREGGWRDVDSQAERTLNGPKAAVKATANELASLQLYPSLTTLPKDIHHEETSSSLAARDAPLVSMSNADGGGGGGEAGVSGTVRTGRKAMAREKYKEKINKSKEETETDAGTGTKASDAS